jgi:hypothetical protein
MKRSRKNPNEVRGDVVERESSGAESQTCPGCGMRREDWKENKGRGIQADDATYCCRGCADGNGCSCGE